MDENAPINYIFAINLTTTERNNGTIARAVLGGYHTSSEKEIGRFVKGKSQECNNAQDLIK